MILDITGASPLSPEHARMLNDLAVELRPRIVSLIDQMSFEQEGNIDWWVTPLASKNPFTSRFFLSCCRLALLDRLLASRMVLTEVQVDSSAMADLAYSLSNRYGTSFRISIPRARKWNDFALRPVKSILASLFHEVMQFICVRLLLARPAITGETRLTLVDTFLYVDSVRGGQFQDKHFPAISKFLTPHERAQLRYFPTCYKIKNYPKIFWCLRKLRREFLFKEDFLRLGDYVYAFGHGIRMGRIRSDELFMLNGLSLNALMHEELRRGWMWPSAIEALLKFRAIGRMREAGVKIGRVLDWFENQDIDRGASFGYRRYYPDTQVVGYVGYVASQHYLCMYPSPAEVKAGVLPTRFAVMGRGFVDALKEFCPDLVVDVVPALRYSPPPPSGGLDSATGHFSLVVALPIVRAEAMEILEAIHHMLQGLEGTPLAAGLHVLIKAHPSSDVLRSNTFELASDAKAQVIWVGEKLDILLRQADVLVSAASSACFEALAQGVPVIVFGSCYGLTYAPIPQAIPPGRWQVCYSWQEMLAALLAFRVPHADAAELAGRLQEEYLEPVSRQGVRQLVLGTTSG